MGKGHDCCYNNSWGSTDLLMLPIFKASSEEHGVAEYSTKAGVPLYYFPEKRVDTFSRLLKKQKERVEEVTRLEKEGQQ